jgi:NTP pyrophosphatase (non-canonical NTP hydrolase)
MTRHISDAAYAVTEWIARRMARHQLNHERNYEAEEVRRRFRPPTFQECVAPWMQACFGAEISGDRIERNHRFLEEALELVQSNGCTEDEAHQLVGYVYGRDQGEINQEAGGVMVTLAALCLASGIDMHAAGETELARVWTKVEQIRAKQAAKPKHSPLPSEPPGVEYVRRET